MKEINTTLKSRCTRSLDNGKRGEKEKKCNQKKTQKKNERTNEIGRFLFYRLTLLTN